jgi:hypothetical protein
VVRSSRRHHSYILDNTPNKNHANSLGLCGTGTILRQRVSQLLSQNSVFAQHGKLSRICIRCIDLSAQRHLMDCIFGLQRFDSLSNLSALSSFVLVHITNSGFEDCSNFLWPVSTSLIR